VKRAYSYGSTDDFGYQAVENVTTIYDLHATMLHLLGLNHERLSFYNNGIDAASPTCMVTSSKTSSHEASDLPSLHCVRRRP